ncbi:map/microtubule affinity-regulating kinase [Anaeramoeba flamelloides]|uniref:Map/microtubule affinity-regulating kinase n=1 Tax=Anaeramoeba flamelloides TaxID=1746091 RepID=A0AAV7ZC47_9EUKA|nr:map/microtubule affinity-regulating kinase [Anaeramoeba flamelloides]
MREMKILQQLNHPNLILLYEIFENEQNWYLVMEYVEGGELFDFVVKRIAYCHSNDIVHRDLKLENLLLTSDFKIKIIDFGLSNFTKGNVLLNTFCGSASYAAPEVLQAKEYDGLKTDVWSLGVLLYVLLVGHFPYETRNIRALVAKKISKTINYPKFISESAKDLISKMLFIDPKLRYSINQVKKHEWFKQDIVTKQLLDATSFYSGELINPLIVIKMTPLGSNYKDLLKDLQSKHFSQHMATF